MPTRRGWKWDAANSRLAVYVDGTEIARFDDATANLTLITYGMTVTSGNLTLTSGNLTLTAGNATLTNGDLTLTSGDATLTSGDLVMTSGTVKIATGGNLECGTAAAFSSTAGTNGISFLAGTAPDGTATNTCKLYSDNSGDDLSVEHADGSEDELTT